MSREKTDKGFCPEKIDLHIHSTFSDGTDTPKQILEHAREIGLDLFPSRMSLIRSNSSGSSDLETRYSAGSGISEAPVRYSGVVPSFCAINTIVCQEGVLAAVS